MSARAGLTARKMTWTTEAGFLSQVREVAKATGWLCYHTHDSRRSEAGFPDLVLCRPPELLFVELKMAWGEVSAEQENWISGLRECGLVSAVWRPKDWDMIFKALSRRRGMSLEEVLDGHIEDQGLPVPVPDLRGGDSPA